MSIKELSEKLSAISDLNRLEIMEIIWTGGKFCVTDIAGELELSVAVVSHHLNVLSQHGFVTSYKEGKRKCYIPIESDFNKHIKKLIYKV